MIGARVAAAPVRLIVNWRPLPRALICRLRRRHQPRPLVPGSHRHAHAGVRRGLARRLVRGKLPGLRGRPAPPARRRGRSAASHQIPEVDAIEQVAVARPRRKAFTPGGCSRRLICFCYSSATERLGSHALDAMT